MAFRISITDEAEAQLKALSARERRTVEAAVHARLRDLPTIPTKAVKRLRNNSVAEFELRVDDLRVLYDVTDEEVVLLVIGRKVGNTLVVSGEEYHEHQADSPESTRGGPTGDVD